MKTYSEVTSELKTAYDKSASEREKLEISSWKRVERRAFLDLLRQEGKLTLLEVGAGPGHDSLFFQQNGLQVVSTDLSPQMVRLCRNKGLEAYEMDFLNLDFPGSRFSAVYALNCLLHVPKRDLDKVLLGIGKVMEVGGIFFMGVYGGIEQNGIWEDDHHRPKRHFSLYTDPHLLKIVERYFEVRDFLTINVPGTDNPEMHFQRFILQKRNNEQAQPRI